MTEVYANGEKGESVAKWIIVDGKIHIIDKNADRVVARINKDDSLTPIADILDGKRINIPKDEQTTLKKTK